jgi:hypothetical protein
MTPSRADQTTRSRFAGFDDEELAALQRMYLRYSRAPKIATTLSDEMHKEITRRLEEARS